MNVPSTADEPGPEKPLSVEKLRGQLSKFDDSINHATPLACVLLATSFLEQCLATLIHNFMVDGRTADELCSYRGGVVYDLAKKAKLAYCCGLIPKGMFNNLTYIGNIRNRFAHAHFEIDFWDTVVRDSCNQMVSTQPEFIVASNDESDFDADPDVIVLDDPDFALRGASLRFRITVTATALHILTAAENVKHREVLADSWQHPVTFRAE